MTVKSMISHASVCQLVVAMLWEILHLKIESNLSPEHISESFKSVRAVSACFILTTKSTNYSIYNIWTSALIFNPQRSSHSPGYLKSLRAQYVVNLLLWGTSDHEKVLSHKTKPFFLPRTQQIRLDYGDGVWMM